MAELQPLVEHTQSSWIQMAMRLARAQLAVDADADMVFQEALTADMTLWPLPRGRLLLAHGAWLRRRRRVSESRSPLRSARDTFDALGAIQWAERACQELRAAGVLGCCATLAGQPSPRHGPWPRCLGAFLDNR